MVRRHRISEKWDYSKLDAAAQGTQRQASELVDEVRRAFNVLSTDRITMYRALVSLESVQDRLKELKQERKYNSQTMIALEIGLAGLYYPLKLYLTGKQH